MSLSLAYKMGKWPYNHDKRTLRLASYLHWRDDDDNKLPDPPATLDLTSKVAQPFPMDDNDRYGDCTCAAAAHMVQVWSALVGQETVPNVNDVVNMYFKITGGPDHGADENNVLSYWRANPLSGWAPAAFLACDPSDPNHIKIASSLFGGVYIGVQLPVSAETQLGGTWDVVQGPSGQPGSWGGHAVNVVGYDAEGVTVATWGKLQKMTWAFWAAYCDEAWCVLPNEWEKAPGINWAQLQEDLKLVTS